MADRERNDLRRQIAKTRRVLEANELRRALLHQRERSRDVYSVEPALGSVARWMREHPVRLVAAAAFVLLGAASLVASSSMTDDEPQRLPIVALPETGQDDPPARAAVTLSMAGSDGDEEPDAESAGDSAAEPDEASGESSMGRPADRGASDESSSSEQAPQATATSSEPEPEPEPDPTPGDPTTEPELSDTGDTDHAPASEPDSADSPEPEAPDDEAGASDGTCLGVNALGLTVDLCLPSLLGG